MANDELISGYRLAEPCGPAREDDGGAVLYRGTRTSDDVAVAVKVFAAADYDRAEREAEIGQAIGHPHVLAATDLVTTADSVALVMPWVEGGSLAQLLTARGRLHWAQALTVLIPLADALAAAHERGFVHGDVSAANVLFDSDGRPLLADFGAGRAAVEAGGEVAVTPCDVAPEVARGATPGTAADLFALGSVALRCLTGRSAWPADDLRDVVVQSAAGQWPDLDDRMAPDALAGVIRQLLAPEPDDRGSAGQLAVDLRSVGEPEPVPLGGVCADDGGPIPLPATQVRPDATRPPAMTGPRTGPDRRTWRRWCAAVGSLRPSRAAMRVVVAVAVACTLVAGAVAGGWWWSGRGAETATVTATLASSSPQPPRPTSIVMEHKNNEKIVTKHNERQPSPDWAQIMTRLDRARSEAFARRDPALLDAVYAPEAAARAGDARRITSMLDAGHVVMTAAHRVTAVTLVRREPDGAAVLEVTESMPGYDVYNTDGNVVGHTRPAAAATVRMHVIRTDGGFRIQAIDTP